MNRRQETKSAKLTARLVTIVAAVCTLNALELCATPIVSEGWDTIGNIDGWTATGPGGATLDNSDRYLSISFVAESVPLPGQDIVRTGAGAAAGLTGDYVANSAQSIGFRFLAQDYPFDGLTLYFASPSRVWAMPLAVPVVGEWVNYRVSLDYNVGWIGGPGADATAFGNDLASVSWVGVGISHNYAGCDSVPAQNYGLDDFATYTETPEPGTCVFLLAATLPLLVMFRGKLKPRWLA